VKQRGDGCVHPMCHQAVAQGAGCDWLGLLRGRAGLEVVGQVPRGDPAYSMIGPSRKGVGALVQAALRHLFREIPTDEAPATCLLFTHAQRGGWRNIWHRRQSRPAGALYPCLQPVTGFTESPWSMPWRRPPIVARFLNFRREAICGTILLQRQVPRCGSVGGRSRGFPRVAVGACGWVRPLGA